MIFTVPMHERDLVEFNRCHAPAGSPAGGQFCSDPTASPAFEAWFGASKVVDEDGDPLRVYHGTTRDFDAFDQRLANVESDFGQGIYFSNEPADIAANYAGIGPDLKSKLEGESERLDDRYKDGDPDVVAQVEARLKARNLSSIEDLPDWEERHALFMELATAKMTAHGGATIPAYLKIENPAILGGKGETYLTLDMGEEDENGDYTSEPTGTLLEFVDTLRNVASRYDDGKVDNAIERMMENFEDLPLSKAVTLLRTDEHFGYYTDDIGQLVSNEIIRQTLEEIGFDGIIDRTVNDKFGTGSRNMTMMAGMNPDTIHYIVFKPEQVKSAIGNRGTYKKGSRKFTERTP